MLVIKGKRAVVLTKDIFIHGRPFKGDYGRVTDFPYDIPTFLPPMEIQYRRIEKSAEDIDVIQLQAFGLLKWLSRRVLLSDMEQAMMTPQQIVYKLIRQNATSPKTAARKLPIELLERESFGQEKVEFAASRFSDVQTLIEEQLECYPQAKWFHVGLDEITFEPFGVCERCKGTSCGELLAEDVDTATHFERAIYDPMNHMLGSTTGELTGRIRW